MALTLSRLHQARSKILIVGILAMICVPAIVFWMNENRTETKTEIRTAQISSVSKGSLKGTNISKEPQKIQTDSTLRFESAEIKNDLEGANAAVLKWDQTGGDEGVDLELRTRNGSKWSNWMLAADSDERKDGTEAPHTAMIIGTDIEAVQYRFLLDASKPDSAVSSEIDLSDASVEIIDTTQGPSPAKQESFIEKTLGFVGIGNKASARMDGPRIFSRAEWGSPEPDSSSWTPEYEPLYRSIVHHTAVPEGSDPAAAIRAIWQYHTYTNGWGDIGYNYLVDANGNIYQGRYFDPAAAKSAGGDVVAGHAYNNNRGTSGIAALGDFTTARPSDRMIDSIANIIAFKLANYGINPSGIGPSGPNVIGHREATSTSCPGTQLYGRIGEVRTVGDIYYAPRVAMNRYDLSSAGQGFDGNTSTQTNLVAGSSAELYFDLKNEGDNPWDNTGSNPVVLGTDRARDRASQFATAGSWRSVNRTASFTDKVTINQDGSKSVQAATIIQPGEIGRFKIIMTAPAGASGSYREHFQLLVEGREWFARDLQLSATINVTPRIYSWRPVGQHIYTDATQTVQSDTNVRPGERVYLVLKAENTGNQTWVKDGTKPDIRIATSNARDRVSSFCDASWIHCGRPTTFSEESVGPGQVGTFGFWIAMPTQSRNFLYYDHYSLVAESVSWMNTEPGVNWPVQLSN